MAQQLSPNVAKILSQLQNPGHAGTTGPTPPNPTPQVYSTEDFAPQHLPSKQ